MRRSLSVLPVLLLALVGCTDSSPNETSLDQAVVSPSVEAIASGSASPQVESGAIASSSPRPSVAASAPSSPAPARPSPVPRATKKPVVPAPRQCSVPSGISANQVILVRGSGTTATVTACTRTAAGWRADLGPYSGHVGFNGVAPSGAKREGDGRTPSGTFPMRGGFGMQANPGLTLGWKSVGKGDVWVDDSASSLYNTRQTGPANGRWRSAETLEQPGPYAIAQVIGYNEARTPGAGSAIFLHVDQGGGTAGCVSIPRGALESVMRWEKPGVLISIS